MTVRVVALRLPKIAVLCVLVLLTFGSALWLLVGHSAGLDVTFNQKILPLNCIFETVDAGTGLLYYVTPAECGVLVTPSASNGQPASSQGRVIGPLPFGTTSVGVAPNSRAILVPGGWQPLASLQNGTVGKVQTKNSRDTSATAAVSLLVVAVAVVAMALLL